MPIVFAGIDLTPTVGAQAQVSEFWHGHRIDEFDHPFYSGVSGTDQLNLPSSPRKDAPRIGVFHYPTGANRWGVCHLVATGAQVTALRAAVGDASGTLVLSDGVNPITASGMWMLPPRPIAQRTSNQFYLITLVDDRWWWWQSNYTVPVDPFPASWDDMLDGLFTAVGVTATISTIPAAYLEPQQRRWAEGYRPVPILIEAACRTVGLRVVRALDGTVACVDYATAAAADSANWTAYQTYVIAGGQLTVGDVARALPESVSVVFPGDSDLVTVKTLTGLAITAYGSETGVAGKTGQIIADALADSTGGEMAAYATQAATDWYNWALALTDCTLRGYWARPITGLDNFQEWVQQPGQMVTRVVRPPFSDYNLYGDRAQPGYTYPVRLLEDGGDGTWKATIRTTATGVIGDGPQLGYGGDDFVLWTDPDTFVGTVGMFGTAVPDPFVPYRWIFVPQGTGGRVVSNDCPIFETIYGTQVMTGITVEYTNPDGTTECFENPTDCCPVVSECAVCEDTPIASTLYAAMLTDCGPSTNQPITLESTGTDEWTSSGTGCTGGATDTNSVAPCCSPSPTVALNPTAFVAVSMKTGGATCLPDSFSMPGGGSSWQQIISGCVGLGITFQITECGIVVAAKYTFSVTHAIPGPGFSAITVTYVSEVCSPFTLVYDVTFPADTVPGGGTARITITIP